MAAFDPQLLQRFRAGEPAAMGEVYRRHVGPLTRLLRSAAFRGQTFASLRSAMELENAIVEVFSRAFEPRARAVYDGLRPYETFLMGIARNYLLERSRERELPHGLSPEEAVAQALADEGPAPDEQVESREVDALVQAFRGTLGAEEAQLFELRFGEGLGQEAAAARLGLTRIQLRRREHKLRVRLLAHLQHHGYLGALAATGWSFVKESA
jgi:RNA polymerase sigma-70 factor (ECF subfamily)